MLNPYKALLDLLPQSPVQLGVVASVEGGTCRVTLEGGGDVWVRGAATVGDRVFTRGGAIEGLAPALPLELMEV